MSEDTPDPPSINPLPSSADADVVPVVPASEKTPPAADAPNFDARTEIPSPVALAQTELPPLLEHPAEPTPVTPVADAPAPPMIRAPKRISTGMWLALGTLGVINLFLSYAAAAAKYPQMPASFKIGAMLGALLFLPGTVMALFAIGKRFRTAHAQAVILLVTWCVTGMGHIGNLSNPRTNRISADVLKRVTEQLPPVMPAPVQPVDPTANFKYRLGDLSGNVTLSPRTKWTKLPSADTPPASPSSDAPRPPAPRSSDAELAAKYDFTSGSDERLIKTIDTAQEDRYHAVVAAYAAACATRPDDAELAVERVRFIAHFNDSEDNSIESAPADYEAAKTYLETYFPEAPAANLFTLQRTFGAAFEPKARAVEPRVASWPKSDAAKYWLLVAQRAKYPQSQHNTVVEREAAEKSFGLNPTPEAGILLAETQHARKLDTAARQTLFSPCFTSAPDWIRNERMALLFELRQNTAAFQEFQVLKKRAPAMVSNYPTAMKLARAGQLAAARTLISELKPTNWNEAWIARRRFEFELEFGSKQQAVDAYRALRATGFNADPLLRDRLTLLQHHPSSGFMWSDLGGFAFLVFIVGLLALAPLVVILPIHYWSLRRQRRGITSTWTLSPWGLSAAWLVFALALVTEFWATWYFNPGAFQRWANQARSGAAETVQVVPTMLCVWIVLTLTALVLLWRGRGWKLFGPGRWSWWSAVGIGLAVAMGARFVAALYTLWVPMAKTPVAQISPGQLETMKAAYLTAGPLGIIALVGVFVPIFEETFLRGVVLGAFAKHIPWIAANIVQAAIFAALHENAWLAPFYFAFGYVAGELVRRSQSLIPSITMHCANNIGACLGVLILNSTRGILH